MSAYTPTVALEVDILALGIWAITGLMCNKLGRDYAVQHFCSNPNTPAGKGFACGSGRAFLFPSSTHRGNFQQVRAFSFCFRHGLEYYRRLLKTHCLYAAKGLPIPFFPFGWQRAFEA
jgi:hypothetical protein